VTEPQRVQIPGSARTELVGAEVLGPVEPTSTVSATVLLRRRADLDEALVTGPDSITPEQLAEKYGAADEDVQRVREVLTGAGLTIKATHPGSRPVAVSGPA
jgi:kumamolisin